MNSMAFSRANFILRCNLDGSILEGILRVPYIRVRTNTQTVGCQIVTQSKRSPIQDFQDFAKPSCLLPVDKAIIYSGSLPKDLLYSLELDVLTSYYIIELSTSQDFDSSLRDTNAAILMCLIEGNGNSLLQRITMLPLEQPIHAEDIASGESLHFRRGSIDIVTFKGSRLEKIEALWIGLESGSWRLDGLRMTVISGALSMSSSSENMDDNQFNCLQHEFEINNTLFGERGISVAELRPLHIKVLSIDDFFTFLHKLSLRPSSLGSSSHTAEASMREYADLKFSLLVYDILLVSTGSSILMLSFSDRASFSFLVGGIVGFMYLFQLQRSVDRLPAPPSANGEKFVESSQGFRRQWLISAVLIATVATALRYRMGGELGTLTPLELFIGVGGFLTSKIAVVLAAFRPIRRNMDNL